MKNISVSARYHFIKDSVCSFDWTRTTERGLLRITTLDSLTQEEEEIVGLCLSLPLSTSWSSLSFPSGRSLIKNLRIIRAAHVAETDNILRKFQYNAGEISGFKIHDAINLVLKEAKENPFVTDSKVDTIIELLYRHLSIYGLKNITELNGSNDSISVLALLQGRKAFDDTINNRVTERFYDRDEQDVLLRIRSKINKAINDLIVSHFPIEEIEGSLRRQLSLCIAMDNVWGNFLRGYYRKVDRILEEYLS